jgi:hypothetical protein
MGNIIKRWKLDPILREYMVNYNPDEFDVGFIPTTMAIKSLVLNQEKINQNLKEKQIPLELKFGM